MAEEPRLLNDRYQLEEVVGEGGMAVVWRARDTVLGRTVAIKILRDQYAQDPEFLARFGSEARAAAALNDPGVVSVHDVGESEGRHYLVMEYVPGRDLKSLIRDQAPLSARQAVAIATQLARAVAAAHAVGLVHRDIKPQNVLVSPDGRMKVADFGIARAVSAGSITAPGLVMGTVHYIAPELAAGEAATPASDVYSLGVVLYEMLTGTVPFDAESSLGVATLIMHQEPEPVEERNPRVPPVLAGIVRRAMARRPEDRYPDAAALADALEGFARWSEQTTGGLEVADEAEPPVVTAGAGVPSAPGPSEPLPPARPEHRQAPSGLPSVGVPEGPLLDRTGLLLAVVALAAVAGLIPLWLAVLTRAERPGGGSPLGAPTALTSPAPATGQQANGGPTPVPQPVPDVVGMSVEEARQRLEREHFGVTTTAEETDDVPPGQVLRQIPAAGEMAAPGVVVNLIVSRPPSVEIPAPEADFQALYDRLLALGLQPQRRPVWSGAGGDVGAVLGLEPPTGSRVPPGSQVYILVDSGQWLGVGATFEDNLHLRAVDLPRDTVAPGDVLTLVTYWEAVGQIQGDYLARAVLASLAGEAVSQAEQPPGERPTSTWQSGERFTSGRFDLPVAATLSPGEYRLLIEVVPVGNLEERLPVLSGGYARLIGGRVLLRTITVSTP